jgi:hypothetical protein
MRRGPAGVTGPDGLLARPGGVPRASSALAAVPIFFAAERLATIPSRTPSPFGPLLAVAGVYAVLTLAGELRGSPLAPARVLASIDLVLITALVATSGGPFSQLRYAFFLLPVGAALLLRPALTAIASAACVALYGLVALTYPTRRWCSRTRSASSSPSCCSSGGWAPPRRCCRRSSRAARATSPTSRRAGAASWRRRSTPRTGRAAGWRRPCTTRRCRTCWPPASCSTPATPESAELAREGLDEGVLQIRRRCSTCTRTCSSSPGCAPRCRRWPSGRAQRARFDVDVDVEPDAEGVQDQLLFSIGRELIANAAKHSEAARLTVRVRRLGDDVELLVADDGRGIDEERARARRATGTSAWPRAPSAPRRSGGAERRAQPGRPGTHARVRVPAAAARPGAAAAS